MDDLPLVKVVETGEDLPHKLGNEGFFERAVVLQEGGDGSTGDVFEENVEIERVGGGVEVLDDVCMVGNREHRSAEQRRRKDALSCCKTFNNSISLSSASSILFFRSSLCEFPVGSSTCLTAINEPVNGFMPR
jgi:hypothetical protein